MRIFILLGALCILLNISCSVAKNNQINQDKRNTNDAPIANNETVKPNDVKKTEILPTADTLSVALTLLRKSRQMPVEADEIFVKDDGVRLNISTVEKGYLYILYKGSSDAAQVLYPSKEYLNGKNEIEPNKTLTIPSKGWFFFDGKKGTETIFVLYSKIRNSKILLSNEEENLTLFEKWRLENGNSNAFITNEGNLVRVIELKHE